METELAVGRWLGAIGSAAALALAAVLAFAAIVSGLTTALAFAIVLALAGMLILVVHTDQANTGCGRRLRSRGLGWAIAGGLGRSSGAANQTGESGGEHKCFQGILHGDFLD
jgi:hypothetical protein